MAENEISLGVSDWIAFLSNEKFGFMNAMVGVASFFIAIIAIMYVSSVSNLDKSIGVGCLVILGIVWYLSGGGKNLYTEGKMAEDLLKKIMKGEFKNKEDIQREWLTRTPGLKRK